jgi:tryptophan-rich sensory protein
MQIRNFKWWQLGLAAIVVSAIGGLSGGKGKNGEKKVYNKFKQAPWAPPAWLFAPAWTLNNFFLLRALNQILAEKMNDRQRLLILQLPIWLIFFSFGYIYSKKKSPILVATWTVSDAVLAGLSFVAAYKENKKLANNFLPLLSWTSFASSVAGYQALKNDDPLLGTKALLV